MPEQPDRAVSWIEVQVVGLIFGVYITGYALMLGLFWGLTACVRSETGKFAIGAASGFVLAALAAAFIKPGESGSWLADRVKKSLFKSYGPFFKPQSGGPPFWDPAGIESHALQDEEFDLPPSGRRISGWGYHARRDRAKFLRKQWELSAAGLLNKELIDRAIRLERSVVLQQARQHPNMDELVAWLEKRETESIEIEERQREDGTI
ncbi:hypothetical protein [Nocardia sp. NPDC004860]|uniref:hypothetical protein n=1 Tax=Nocardia sp. NPDC004860 TaxID=3154557 RepID=UPI0033A216C4